MPRSRRRRTNKRKSRRKGGGKIPEYQAGIEIKKAIMDNYNSVLQPDFAFFLFTDEIVTLQSMLTDIENEIMALQSVTTGNYLIRAKSKGELFIKLFGKYMEQYKDTGLKELCQFSDQQRIALIDRFKNRNGNRNEQETTGFDKSAFRERQAAIQKSKEPFKITVSLSPDGTKNYGENDTVLKFVDRTRAIASNVGKNVSKNTYTSHKPTTESKNYTEETYQKAVEDLAKLLPTIGGKRKSRRAWF